MPGYRLLSLTCGPAGFLPLPRPVEEHNDGQAFSITQTLKSGEELHYALILANIYKRGLQKVEFTVKKQ